MCKFSDHCKQCKHKKLFSADPNIHVYPGLVVFCDRLASIYTESLQQASMGPQEHSPANFIEQSVCREPVALLPPQGAANLQNACLQQIIFQDQITLWEKILCKRVNKGIWILWTGS